MSLLTSPMLGSESLAVKEHSFDAQNWTPYLPYTMLSTKVVVQEQVFRVWSENERAAILHITRLSVLMLRNVVLRNVVWAIIVIKREHFAFWHCQECHWILQVLYNRLCSRVNLLTEALLLNNWWQVYLYFATLEENISSRHFSSCWRSLWNFRLVTWFVWRSGVRVTDVGLRLQTGGRVNTVKAVLQVSRQSLNTTNFLLNYRCNYSVVDKERNFRYRKTVLQVWWYIFIAFMMVCIVYQLKSSIRFKYQLGCMYSRILSFILRVERI